MPERTRRRTVVDEDGTVVKTETDRERLERMLWNRLNDAGLPAPETQYRWAPGRQFRADFAYPDAHILIEVQGGIWARDPGRHNRASGYQADLARSNLAQQLGWRLYAFTEKMIRSDEAVDTIRRALEAPTAATHQLVLTGGTTDA
jgi:very-short-patch-repair endonuclease